MKENEVLDHIKSVNNVSVKQVAKDPATKIIVTPDMVTMRPRRGARLLEVDRDEGVRDLFKFLHCPPDLMGKVSPDTSRRVLNDLIDTKEQFELIMRDGKIIGFRAVHRGHNMPCERVLDSIDKVIEKADYNKAMVLANQAVDLEIVGIDKKAVSKGDIIRAGARVMFSPLGGVNPTVQSFVLRLACTNGATSNNVLREYSFGSGGGDAHGRSDHRDGLWSWFRKSLKEAYSSYNEIVDRYKEMVEDRIPDDQRAMMLENMIREAGLDDATAKAVRDRAIEQPPQNSYDMFNLLTWATSHLITEPKRIQRARRAVEVFQAAESHGLFCPVCRQGRHTVRALPALPAPRSTEAAESGAAAVSVEGS